MFSASSSCYFTVSSHPAGVCSVWSEYHYLTFDAKPYNFKANCSYYLVKEIINKYNLTIIVNNNDCDPSDTTFCPQSLTVTYGSYTVLLTQLMISGTATNVVSNQTLCQRHSLFFALVTHFLYFISEYLIKWCGAL